MEDMQPTVQTDAATTAPNPSAPDPRRPTVSVLMTVYNGHRYLR